MPTLELVNRALDRSGLYMRWYPREPISIEGMLARVLYVALRGRLTMAEGPASC